MSKKIILFGVLFLMSLSVGFAKRSAPAVVPPITHNGFEYRADYASGAFFDKGIVLVYDVEKAKPVKKVTVYKVKINRLLERDVQWVFISKMELLDDSTIRIRNEKGDEFDLNLKNYKVKKVK